jgi:hypothetical protein
MESALVSSYLKINVNKLTLAYFGTVCFGPEFFGTFGVSYIVSSGTFMWRRSEVEVRTPPKNFLDFSHID